MYSLLLEIWNLLLIISPYLLFGFLFAGFLSVIMSQELIEKNLGNKQGLFSIIKAALFGVPLPLCSCSVIPVSASLKKHGASKGAVTSFLFSTPQTGIDSIMVTYGMLGPIVALIRPFIALLTGILCGSIVYGFDREYDNIDTEDCHDECCEPLHQSAIKRILNYSFITLPKDIIKPLMVGIIIAALINIYLPITIIDNFVGQGFLSMIIMIIIGLPLYVCATASIPIALAMMGKGVTLGAALVFLMVGPATNTTSITTMVKILGKKSTIITICSLIVISLCFGMLVDSLALSMPHILNNQHTHTHTSIVNIISAIFMIMITLNTLIRLTGSTKSIDAENKLRIKISGMTCNHCTETIEKGIRSMGVSDVDVNLDSSIATIGTDIDVNKIKDKIRSLGFEIND
jgi:uncharacterized membrane protein YraQ (UPF0718 family)/copper chaperone CopZ